MKRKKIITYLLNIEQVQSKPCQGHFKRKEDSKYSDIEFTTQGSKNCFKQTITLKNEGTCNICLNDCISTARLFLNRNNLFYNNFSTY